jgi:hypothetical protein
MSGLSDGSPSFQPASANMMAGVFLVAVNESSLMKMAALDSAD